MVHHFLDDYLLGLTLKDLWKPDEAVATYRRALAIKPDFSQAHSNLGNALQDLGRLDDAALSYRRAIEISPDFADAYYNLGNVLKKLGEFGRSLTHTRQAITLLLKKLRVQSETLPADPFPLYRRKTPMSVPAAHATLDILRSRLDGAGPVCSFGGAETGGSR